MTVKFKIKCFHMLQQISAFQSVAESLSLSQNKRYISDFVRVFDMSLQQYLPIITNESEHIFINPQAKEPTQCKKLLIFG